MAYNRTDFKNDIATLQIDGFKLKSAVQAYLYIRKHNDRTETITISYRDYAPHGFYISGVSVDIYFNEVEEILEKYELGQEYKSTFGKSFQNLEGIDYELLSTEIDSEERFSVVSPVVIEIIEKAVKPFLVQFSNLQNIACFLADKNVEQIVPYIQGSILYPKTILILKLSGHPNFKKRLMEFRNVLLKNVDDNYRYPILLEKYDTLFADDLRFN